MIRYVGGKTHLSKEIMQVIVAHKKPEHKHYVETCVGGGSIISKSHILNLTRIALDINPDLIEFYQALQKGWIPPKTVTECEYNQLKHAESSPLRTWAGYEASFGGKWFGGYARGNNRNFSNEGYRRIIPLLHTISDVHFRQRDLHTLIVDHTTLMYVDPPYQSTMGYAQQGFDHTRFWETMRRYRSQSAIVLISEYAAPDDFTCIWQKDHFTRTHLSNNNSQTTERIFV